MNHFLIDQNCLAPFWHAPTLDSIPANAMKPKLPTPRSLSQSFGLVVALSASSLTSIADVISFQGVLNGTNRQSVPNGTYSLTFRFYSVPDSGIAFGTNALNAVPVTNGLFSTLITVESEWFKSATHLGVSINQQPELTPRMRLTTVPYAIHAKSAGNEFGDLSIRTLYLLDDATPPAGAIRGTDGTWLFGYVGGSGTEEIILGSREAIDSSRSLSIAAGGHTRVHIAANGNVGIGTTVPQSLLHLDGTEATIRLTDGNARGVGVLRGNGGTWLFGYNGFRGSEDISIGSSDTTGTRTLTLNAGGFPRVRVSDNGFVGVNTLQPQTHLHVDGTTRTTVLQISSDRNVKQGFQKVDARAILEKLAALPISTWAYTNCPQTRHIGPVAQDFKAAFSVGDTDKHVATVDADGVALAAIQGLHEIIQEQQATLRAREAELLSVQGRLQDIERVLATLTLQPQETTK